MKVESKNREQLLEEVSRLRLRIVELEEAAARHAVEEVQSGGAYFLQTLIDAIPTPIFYKDAQGRYLGCNRAFERFLGVRKEQIVGKSVYEVAPRALAEIYAAMDTALLENPGVQVYETAIRTANGSLRDVVFNKATFSDAAGGVSGLVGVILDITERKRAERALREGELFTRATLNALQAHIAILDAHGVILDTNKAWQDFAQENGLPYYGFVGRNYLAVCDEARGAWAEGASLAAEGIRAVIGGSREEFALEYPCHSPSEKRWFTMRVTRLLGEGPPCVVMAHQNITERRLAEEAMLRAHDELELRVRERTADLARANEKLRIGILERKKAEERIVQQNEFLNHVLESLTHPFYVLDASNYRVVMANSAAARGGLPPDATCYALTHNRSEPCEGSHHFCPLRMIKETRKPLTVEHVHYDRNGVPRNVEVHAYPIFNAEGEVVQIIEYSFDISERKKLEEALRTNAEKIKRFAYSVSHDLKSPLIGINGLTRLLQKQYRDVLDEKGRHYCDRILRASEQVVALVEEINVYIRTKETPLHFETIDPKELLEMIRDEFGPLLSTRGIHWKEPERIPQIRADRMSLLRVFRNLVDNALKYGGEEMTEIRIGYMESNTSHTFVFSDDGVGIRKEDSERIFGLFQRHETARGVEGSGLGLAIVKEIVEKHRGEVWVESGSPKGATFYVTLSKAL